MIVRLLLKAMARYIPIYQYARKHGTSEQNVYRWIREGKFGKDEVIREKVEQVKLRISAKAKPKLSGR